MNIIYIINFHNFDWKLTNGVIRKRVNAPHIQYIDYLNQVVNQDDFLNAIRVECLLKQENDNIVYIKKSKNYLLKDLKRLQTISVDNSTKFFFLAPGFLFLDENEVEQFIETRICENCIRSLIIGHPQASFRIVPNVKYPDLFLTDWQSSKQKRGLENVLKRNNRLELQNNSTFNLNRVEYLRNSTSNSAGLESLFSNLKEISYTINCETKTLCDCKYI